MVKDVADIISDINKSGISILLVEQNAGLVTQVADRGYVLEVGKVVLEVLKETLSFKDLHFVVPPEDGRIFLISD